MEELLIKLEALFEELEIVNEKERVVDVFNQIESIILNANNDDKKIILEFMQESIEKNPAVIWKYENFINEVKENVNTQPTTSF